jgi:hypothetical protein
MKVLSYKYVKPNEDGIVEGLDRQGYMTPQYMEMMRDYLDTIELKGKCAFLYAGGAMVTASEARNVNKATEYREPVKESTSVIKELAAYSMHKWIGALNERANIRYANVNANTCASSMHSLYEANRLLNDGFDEVVIVAEEKTAYNTLRIFDEHDIDLKVGEGCVVIHLGKASSPADEDITECKWEYEYNRNPFGVTSTGYARVTSECDIVKPHGTGTVNNEEAEKVFKEKPQLRYKETYGHTQGVSGLLEVCMAMEEPVVGDILCVSSGLGGFYGSCIVKK